MDCIGKVDSPDVIRAKEVGPLSPDQDSSANKPPRVVSPKGFSALEPEHLSQPSTTVVSSGLHIFKE